MCIILNKVMKCPLWWLVSCVTMSILSWLFTLCLLSVRENAQTELTDIYCCDCEQVFLGSEDYLKFNGRSLQFPQYCFDKFIFSNYRAFLKLSFFVFLHGFKFPSFNRRQNINYNQTKCVYACGQDRSIIFDVHLSYIFAEDLEVIISIVIKWEINN